MIFYEMKDIAGHVGVDNKYMITLAVAHRARMLSERRVRPLPGEEMPAEKYVSKALEDLEEGSVAVHFGPAPLAEEEQAENDGSVEE